MNDGPHPYQELSLFSAGLVLGLVLTGLYGVLFFKPEASKAWATKLPRHYQAGVWTMGIGMIWFWLLVAPSGKGLLSSLSMDLGDFNRLKGYLVLAVPLFAVGMIFHVKEFLFVRGLGLCLLMFSGPLLYAADFEKATFKNLIPTIAYLMIIKGIYFVGMPYLFRDGVTWLTAKPERWKFASLSGFVLGILVLICSVIFWRDY